MRPGSRPGRPGGSSFGEWSARQRCLDGGPRVVVLRGLAERVQLEVLYALQRAAETGRRTRPGVVQGAVNIVRAQGVSSISGLSMEGVKRGAPRLFLTFAADQVTLALSTRAGEAARDDWDQRVFGHIPGLLRFSPISQGCVKETAKGLGHQGIDQCQRPGLRGGRSTAGGAGPLRSLRRRRRPEVRRRPRLVASLCLRGLGRDLGAPANAWRHRAQYPPGVGERARPVPAGSPGDGTQPPRRANVRPPRRCDVPPR